MRVRDLIQARGLCAAAASLALSVAASGQEAERYVRAAEGGAHVRNFADAQGLSVRELPEGALMRVHSEQKLLAGKSFLEVSVPDGLRVWVYGEYLEPVGEDGLMRVTTTSVNMRPNPGTSVANLPIGSKLDRGDLVRSIGRSDPGRPLGEDWVEIHSPADARGWVALEETVPAPDVDAARADWERAEREAAARPPSTATPEPEPAEPRDGGAPPTATAESARASSATPADAGSARERLAAADRAFDEARDSEAADWTPVRDAYRRVLDASPDTTTAELARRRLEEVEVLSEFAALREEIAGERTQREEKLADIEREMEVSDLARTPNWGRFHGRGWLERREEAGRPVYRIVFAGEPVAHVVCTSGRYDLSVFEGFEIGVMGSGLRTTPGVEGVGGGEGGVLDVHKIEVISGSGTLRR